MFELIHSPFRPECPNCGLDLVFVALVVDDVVIETWMCDCGDQIPAVRDAIVDARNTSEESASVITLSL